MQARDWGKWKLYYFLMPIPILLLHTRYVRPGPGSLGRSGPESTLSTKGYREAMETACQGKKDGERGETTKEADKRMLGKLRLRRGQSRRKARWGKARVMLMSRAADEFRRYD